MKFRSELNPIKEQHHYTTRELFRQRSNAIQAHPVGIYLLNILSVEEE